MYIQRHLEKQVKKSLSILSGRYGMWTKTGRKVNYVVSYKRGGTAVCNFG